MAFISMLTFIFMDQFISFAGEIKNPVVSNSKDKLDGWITEANITYYYKEGERAVGPVTIAGENYFFDLTTGAKTTGLVSYQGKLYYYEPETGIQKRGFVNWENNVYFFGKNGNALKGIRRINGKRYYFDTNGIMVRNSDKKKILCRTGWLIYFRLG